MRYLFPIVSLSLYQSLTGATTEISNQHLTVRFDDVTQRFSVASAGSDKPFATDGRLSGKSTTVAAKDAVDPVFGTGKSLVVTFADGGSASLDIYQNLPFALVRETRANSTGVEVDLKSAVPATFTVDLGKSASALATMGTGGLLPPDKNPGSYLFLACADPATRRGVVTGFISQNRGSGVIFPKVAGDTLEVESRLDHGHLILAPGKSAILDTMAIGCFDDARIGLERFADAVAKSHQIKLRPKTAVYCSWYAEGKDHGRAGTPATTRELAKFIHDKKLQDHGLTVIQLDDGWQDGPNIQGPATEFDRVNPKLHYKDGIAPVAKAVSDENLTFGLWWLPFGRNHMEPQYANRQDWFFKWPDGKPLRQRGFGGTCLDSTHPEVQKHLESLSASIRSWGVKYYKMDGLSVGSGVDHVYINDSYKNDRFGESQPPHDRTKTQIEAMRLGLQTIRKGAGDDVFFSGCCAVQNMRIYAGSIGLVDSMRVGPDFNHDGEGIRSGPLRGSWVYFLNGKVWWNDPDPTKVRTSNEPCEGDSSIRGGVTLDQARMTSSWVSLTNQFYLISDWLPSLPEERLDILKKTMAAHHGAARPVDYFDNKLPNTWLVTDTASGSRRDVLGIFNFHGKPLAVSHTLEKTGLDPAKTYHAYDYWNDRPLPDVSSTYQDELPANSCRVVSLRAVEGRPLVISTSRHVTQGMIDLSNETWENNTLAGKAAVIANEPYELRIRVPDGWALDKASATLAGTTLEAAATSQPGLVRVRFTPARNGTVDWNVAFKPAPKPNGVSIRDLKAGQSTPDSPVLLRWQGSTMFYRISRDGKEIAAGHYGATFEDSGAPAGKSVTYTVTPVGGPPNAKASAAVTLVTKAFTPIAAPPKPQVSLSTLKPVSVKTGHGKLMPNQSVDGTPLTLSGTVYPDGIGLHAAGEASYACQPGWKEFVATVGLDDSQRKDPRASIVCSVTATDGNGKSVVIAKTPVLASGKTMDWNIRAAIPAGTATITLHTGDAGDGINCDHSDWVNAGFLTR